ncbi:uncharacterized protein [Patagioenas fasciata]|uniref:uncharacterized protein n=1 Tax=Patagioenas fasciata TaxID=372321 RepID=UPI003A9A21B7
MSTCIVRISAEIVGKRALINGTSLHPPAPRENSSSCFYYSLHFLLLFLFLISSFCSPSLLRCCFFLPAAGGSWQLGTASHGGGWWGLAEKWAAAGGGTGARGGGWDPQFVAVHETRLSRRTQVVAGSRVASSLAALPLLRDWLLLVSPLSSERTPWNKVHYFCYSFLSLTQRYIVKFSRVNEMSIFWTFQLHHFCLSLPGAFGITVQNPGKMKDLRLSSVSL